jgi:hypothetical protein
MDQKIVGSIKTWAVVLGVLSLFTLWTLSIYPLASVQGILAALGLILGIAVLYAGLKVASMSLQTVAGIVWAKFILLVIDFLLSFTARRISVISLLIIVVEGAIAWYLIMCLKKIHRS